MAGEKYQIFISSTYKDLIGPREAITKAILNLYHIPIGMEMFSADNNDQWDTIKATIEDSDYYILIIGHRYGSETPEGISFTEKEYNYAKELKVPILAFIRNRDVPTKPEEWDSDKTSIKKLNAFIKKASSNAMIDYWIDEKDLATHIVVALTKAFKKYSRVGWIRADKAASPKVAEEIAALSKQNRELKDEIQKFKYDKGTRLPKFEISINDNYEIFQEFIPDSELIRLSEIYLKPIDSIPYDLGGFVYPSVINNYNKIIQNNSSEIIEYNNQVLIFERSLRANKLYEVEVKNIGNIKGNHIIAEFKFPNNVMACEKSHLNRTFNIARPQYIPEHPFETAKRTKRSNGHRYVLDTIPKDYEDTDFEDIMRKNYSIKANKLTIKFDDILHTQVKKISNKFYLIPKEIGDSVINVSIICEEFHEPQLITIPITITKSLTA